VLPVTPQDIISEFLLYPFLMPAPAVQKRVAKIIKTKTIFKKVRFF
jgi:hypothetical protein